MPDLVYEKQGMIGVLTMNRPDALNAFSPEMVVRLADATEEIAKDDGVRVVVITGAGDKSFCSGADLKRLIPLITGARDPEDEWDHALRDNPRKTEKAIRRFDPDKPVIAAVNGFAVAGGMELLQTTDIRIAAEHARFGLQEPKWGLFPLAGSTVRLPRQVPYCQAMEILLTGNLIDAERALHMGLINHVVPGDQVLPTAMEFAETIAANGPLAVQAIRRSVRACTGLPEKEALKVETELGMPIFGTEDAREGPRAFAEKRPANFQGR